MSLRPTSRAVYRIDRHFYAGRPLLTEFETDNLSVSFVMSTNGDDPAGIQREKPDIKPRMTQSRLGSVAVDQVRPAQRGSATAPSQKSRASTVLSQRPITSTPSTAAGAHHFRQPLFRPRDIQSPEAAQAPIKVDDEEDDNSLWAEVDAADPSFTQEAMRIDDEVPAFGSPGDDAGVSLDTTSAGTFEIVTSGVDDGEAEARNAPDVIDMSLDEDAEETVFLSGRSKRPRKVCPLLLKLVGALLNHWWLGRTGNWGFELISSYSAFVQLNNVAAGVGRQEHSTGSNNILRNVIQVNRSQ